jgi:hypothetical protein
MWLKHFAKLNSGVPAVVWISESNDIDSIFGEQSMLERRCSIGAVEASALRRETVRRRLRLIQGLPGKANGSPSSLRLLRRKREVIKLKEMLKKPQLTW